MTMPPTYRNIGAYVDHYAQLTPDAEALVLGDERLTFADFKTRMDALSRWLISAGVREGDRVATLQTPCPDYLIAFFAAASIGAIWMGLNPKYRRAELEYVVIDAQPSILLTRLQIGERSYAEDIPHLRAACQAIARVVTFEDDAAEGLERLSDALAEGRVVTDAELEARRAAVGGRTGCLLVYTSGSTGAPKGAVLHHEGIIALSLMQNEVWPVAPYRSLNFLPINHVGCTVDLAVPCVLAGGAMIFMEQFDVRASLDMIEREGVTFLGSVPSVFALQIADSTFDERDFSAVQLIVWEGAAVPSEVFERLAAICPRLATNYGMTETTSAMTVEPPSADRDVLLNSVGSVVPGVELRLAGPEDAEVPDGEVGEVQARSKYNFLGYWGRPEATRDAFTEDGFFRTGDLATRRPDGRYRIVGRLKEMFKSGGYNVYPREIETVLEAHPAVAICAVVPVPDPLWQEVGVAFVIPKPGHAVEPDELIAWCRERLANYKVPKRCKVVSELPLLPIGKIDKVALRKRAAEG
ncbi:MAG: acyl--CoA ligase [Blastomonas sp.]|jgi:acyl-CoA synthetase (AMP-forming)/AMP-acid ligase II|uniref:class I adenylate-forming enzyme family protein n=1 Tax=Blastomonas sp. TaxID=1909299 RepID=UPI0025877877|nr:class I adenylate-forming enzyme family protein [Blastomonas sp.]MCO5792544.1 acyl--CoA ligase [Blastomonas sp.]